MTAVRQDILETLVPLLCLLAVVAVTVGVAAIVYRVWPFYRRLIRADVGARPSDGSSRFEQLDGLRGILCLMVVVHHSIITLLIPAARGDWGQAVKLARPYLRLNGTAVSMFFCVTAFLFYRRSLANVAKGRPALEPRSFFIQRVMRIAPAVLFSGVLIFALDAANDGRFLPRNTDAFWPLLVRILTFGATGGGKDVDYDAGVMWTLGYEWMFYLAFPLLAAACAARLSPLLVIAAWVGVVGLSNGGLGGMQGLMFMPGLLAAALVGEPKFERLARSTTGSASVLGLFVLAIASARLNTGTTVLLAALLVLFPLVAGGCDCFGLLRLPSLRALGVISFSVYLFHGFVLYLARPLLSHVRPLNNEQPMPAITAMIGVAVVSSLISFVTYRWIEHPGIELGRRWTRSRLP